MKVMGRKRVNKRINYLPPGDPDVRTARGMMRAVRIDDSKRKPRGKGRTAVKKAPRKSARATRGRR